LACVKAKAQLPPDFPQLSIAPNTNPVPGYLFGSVNAGGVAGKSNYFAILDNGLNPILLSKTNSLGKLACNGLFVENQGKKGSPVSWVLKDSSFNVVATYVGGNGYMADNHDFEVLPNGHAVIECADNTPVVDMSKLVPGGFPAALPTEFIIQEVDVDGNVVFQWKSLDHVPVTDSYQNLTGQNLGDYIHVNSLWFDETDGTIILSCRNTSEVIKISRVTGDVIWRMQGKHNQFTFTNGIPGNTDPAYFQVQHNARRLPNGNLTIFDNGYSDHSDPQYGFFRPYTRGVEYVIDEVNMTARLVWAFRHNPDIIDYQGGTFERLPEGHGIIQWGGANGTATNNAMTEADENGNFVADVMVQSPGTGGFTRRFWPLETSYVTVTKRELYSGNDYVFTSDDLTKATGVKVHVTSRDGEDYNSVTVSRQPFAPVLPRFMDKAPRVESVRVVITQTAITSMTADLSFDAVSFGFREPTHTTVYYRQTPGEGLFVPLATEYNWTTHQVLAAMSDFGEFIFGFPDLAEVPYAPLLKPPAPGAAVNQTLPVSFSWTPKGFAEGYHLQVSTNASFATLVVDASDLTESRYTNVTVAAGTRYYWRVNTSNYGGVSDWATNSFTTVPPMVQVTVPNGGEAWKRGSTYNIQWSNNVAENVALDLYKAGAFVKTLTTNSPNIPAYSWSISVSTIPASDYSIRIRSTTNAALFDSSDQYFSIVDAPVLDSSSMKVLPNGRVQFGLTGPGAATATVLGSSNLTTWEVLQSLTLTNGVAAFTDGTATNCPTRFYRVRVP
jgi:hypothetical protein